MFFNLLLTLLMLMKAQLMASESINETWKVSDPPFPGGVHAEYCGEICGPGWVMAAQVGPFKGFCWLWVSDAWNAAPESVQRYYINHEVGHCLGIPGHGLFFGETQPNLMNQDPGIGEPTAWDFTMLRYYLPMKYRTRVPMVGVN